MAPRYTKEKKQNIATKFGLTFNNVESILGWNNKVFDGEQSMDDLKWVDENDEYISEFYQKLVQSSNIKATTLRKVYSTMTVFFKKVVKNASKAKEYGTLNKIMSEAENKADVKQTLRVGEKYLPYNVVCGLRDDFLNKWYADPTDKKLNIKSLILSINTYSPPLRGEMRNMKIYSEKPKKMRDINYVYRQGSAPYPVPPGDGGVEPPKWFVFIGEKIKEQRKRNFSIPLGNKLSNIISKSMEYFPRKFVLAGWNTNGSKHITDDMYSDFLSSNGIGINGLRKSYITEFYNNGDFRERVSGIKNGAHNQITREQKEWLAQLMRHSVDTQEKYYAKINADVDQQIVKNTEKLKQEVVAIELGASRPHAPGVVKGVSIASPFVPKKRPGPVPQFENVAEYQAQYRLKHRAKARGYMKSYYDKDGLRQKARVYVRKLNLPTNHKNYIKNPSDKIKDKYKLTRTNNKWTSGLLTKLSDEVAFVM